MMDLLIILVPFLPKESAKALFGHAAGERLIGSDDPAVQKKSYRVLARLIEGGKVLVGGKGLEAFVARLADGGEVVAAAARRVSFTFSTLGAVWRARRSRVELGRVERVETSN